MGSCCAVFHLRLATGASLHVYTQEDDNIILERALERDLHGPRVSYAAKVLCVTIGVWRRCESELWAVGVSALNALAQAIKAALHASESVWASLYLLRFDMQPLGPLSARRPTHIYTRIQTHTAAIGETNPRSRARPAPIVTHAACVCVCCVKIISPDHDSHLSLCAAVDDSCADDENNNKRLSW